MKKLKNNKGFSLTEVLVAVLIMAMVTAVAAAGIPTATNTYRRIVDKANAQLLATTTTNTLRNQLDLAKDVQKVTSGSAICITFKTSEGNTTTITSPRGSGITIQEYCNYSTPGTARPLVSLGTAYTTEKKSMYVEIGDVSVAGGFVTLTGITVKAPGTTPDAPQTLVSIDQFVIKTE